MEQQIYIFPKASTIFISSTFFQAGSTRASFSEVADLIVFLQSIVNKEGEGKPTQMLLTLEAVKLFSRQQLIDTLSFVAERNIFVYRYLQENEECYEAVRFDIRELLSDMPEEYPTVAIASVINNKTILVTGAAGSIGSELCRLIVSLGLNIKLILADIAESPLYELYRELELLAGNAQELIPIVADISDYHHYRRIFLAYTPHLVYHAAAGKQLPLMEGNAYHAMKVNLLATHHLGQLAIEVGSEAFVLVSTDKAVEATSVMGATKRAAEICIQSYKREQNTTRFLAARFGNVIGSNGSVIPFFEQEIPKGYLSITHPEMTRYFVSIQRACMLLLQMGLLKEKSGLFTFEMGEQISILQLAKLMIFLAGKQASEVEIRQIGVRLGEKLSEKMLEDFQLPMNTSVQGIYAVKDEIPPASMVKSWLLWLEQNITKCSEVELLSFLREICPTLPEQSVASNFQDFVKKIY